MQYVPLWTNILKSRKVGDLSPSEFRFWILCLLSAQENDHRKGTLPSLDDLAYSLHMEPPKVESLVSRLVTLGFVTDRDGVFMIHDWQDWKHNPDPTAAERKRRQRAKLGGSTNDSNVTDVTDVTRDTEMSRCHAPTEHSIAEHSRPPLPPGGGPSEAGDLEPFQAPIPEPPTADPLTDRVVALADEVSAGGLGSWASNRIRLGDPPAWVESAIREGVDAGILAPKYLGKILERYVAQKGPKPLAPGRTARKDNAPKSPNSDDQPWLSPEHLAKAEANRIKLAEITAGKDRNGHSQAV